MNLSTETTTVLNNLRKHIECEITAKDGSKWGSVYLDNGKPDGMSDKTFRAILATLSKAGYYKVVDGYAFGDVKLEN